MKILTTKNQQHALNYLDKAVDAIVYGDEIQKLRVLEYLAEVTYIIGGIDALNERVDQFKR